MSLLCLSITHGWMRLAPSLRAGYRDQVRRQEGGLPMDAPGREPCTPPSGRGLGCWLVRATLALYLLPALLIVLLVGALGILALNVARLDTR